MICAAPAAAVPPVDLSAIDPEAAARELLRRTRARASLVEFAQAITIPGAPISEDPDEWLYKPIETRMARHHIVTCEAIERCIRTPYGRLMIFEPPGSAKSTYASVVAPAWAMGAFPGLRVLEVGYAATPIIRHSKRARQVVASEDYRTIWPDGSMVPGKPAPKAAELEDGSRAADEWELKNGSGLFAAGLMGGITSSRCDLGIIDDPVAGRSEADSEQIRANTRQAYEDDFLTRLKPSASIILIQTRWNQDDLAGSILPEDYDGASGPILCRDGQVWEVLNIPAKCERGDDPLGRELGEYLWPEWFKPQHWAIFEHNPRTWASLYQQRPAPPDGIYFKRENFQRYTVAPVNVRVYMASDWALTEKQKGGDPKKKKNPDFTEHGQVGVTEDDEIYVLDWWRDQKELDKTAPAAVDMIARRKPVLWFGESGGPENAAGPYVNAEMRKRKVYAARELLPSITDKVARAAGIIGRVGARTVYLPYTEWAEILIDQLCAFPAGRYDDGVDVMSLIGRGLDMLAGPRKPAPAEIVESVKPFTRRHFEAIEQDEKERERRKKAYYR